jgi:hypothetical protein
LIPSYRARLVLLGASNLTRCLPVAIAAARDRLGAPLDCFIAAGHGRSFGKKSSVLCRALPGIIECGLWDSLASASAELPLPTFAVISDLGNDIMYGETPETIIDWVNQSISRLQRFSASITLSQIPLASIRTVGPKRYAIVKAIMFPTRNITFTQAISRAEQLAVSLQQLASQREIPLVEHSPAWYGFDPIHVRPRCKPVAWSTFLQPLARCDDGAECSKMSWHDRVRLRLATPRQWWLLKHELARTQPAAILADGSPIHLY